jgi:hypothetical protein
VKKLALPAIGVGTAAIALSLAASAVSASPVAAAAPWAPGAGGASCAACASTATPTAPLTAAQAADLQAMAEEEKVARDLYLAFAARYPSRTWDAIAAAEATHLAAVRTLLSRYGIADPTAGKAAGAFASSWARSLYDRLLAQGSASEAAAFGVGKAIEIDDIARLDGAIARATQPDVRQVYANLRKGSTRHLRAFERQLAR